MKKGLLIGLSLCMLFLLTGCNDKKPSGNTTDSQQGVIQTNTNENVIGDKVIGDLKISRVSLVREQGETKIMFAVTNNSSKKISYEFIKVTYKDANDEALSNLTLLLGDIEAGATKEVLGSTYVDLLKAADVEYVLK